ncbi:MAG TPA: hypothetical protein VGL94_23015 [Ktedonobacteraceae bacterium]
MKLHVSAMVPLTIRELLRIGGPTQEHFDRARVIGQDIAERGDMLLFRSKKKGETAEMMNELVEGLAILAFCPGGFTFMGLTFDAQSMRSRLEETRL